MTALMRPYRHAAHDRPGASRRLMPDGMPFRFTAYDGSAAGPADSPIHLHLANERGLSYLAHRAGRPRAWRAPTSSGDLTLDGVHPGDPYDAMLLLQRESGIKSPRPAEALRDRARPRAGARLKPPPPPPQEALPRWRRLLEGFRHSQDTRRRGDPAPLRRLQPLLRAGARAVDDLHLRAASPTRRDARGGAGRQVRPRRPQARPASRGCGCSTSAAAGAAWSGTPRSTTA